MADMKFSFYIQKATGKLVDRAIEKKHFHELQRPSTTDSGAELHNEPPTLRSTRSLTVLFDFNMEGDSRQTGSSCCSLSNINGRDKTRSPKRYFGSDIDSEKQSRFGSHRYYKSYNTRRH